MEEINCRILSRTWHFSERVSRIVGEKKMTFYKEWEDRFVEFCLYRYLMEMAEKRGLISENYVSCKGKGRNYAIKKLFYALKDYPYVFKTDIKSYFASCVFQSNWPDLFNGQGNNRGFRKIGIFQGSSLSSYYAWIYLEKLDDFFTSRKIFYQRYKDDIIIFSKSVDEMQWIQDILYSILRQRKLTTRYKKTFEGISLAPIAYLGLRIRKNSIGQSIESKEKNKIFIPIVL